MKKLTDAQSSSLRALLRAALVCVTAFGFRLDPAQIAEGTCLAGARS